VGVYNLVRTYIKGVKLLMRPAPTLRPIFLAANTVCILILISTFEATCSAQGLTPAQQLARDIYKELIDINTTDTPF